MQLIQDWSEEPFSIYEKHKSCFKCNANISVLRVHFAQTWCSPAFHPWQCQKFFFFFLSANSSVSSAFSKGFQQLFIFTWKADYLLSTALWQLAHFKRLPSDCLQTPPSCQCPLMQCCRFEALGAFRVSECVHNITVSEHVPLLGKCSGAVAQLTMIMRSMKRSCGWPFPSCHIWSSLLRDLALCTNLDSLASLLPSQASRTPNKPS